MMKKQRAWLALVPLVMAGAAGAAVPPVDGIAVPAQIRCNTQAGGVAVNAVHADKIVFRLMGALQAQLPADQPALNAVPRETPLDIKVLDDPKAVADLRGKVLSFLGAANTQPNRDAVEIGQVLYAMVCPVKPFTPPTE